MTFNQGMMTSIDQTWKTPTRVYDELNKEFKFDFDPCPANSNFNGLEIDWGLTNFVNPPYKHLAKWIEKSWIEWKKGKTIVMLIPSRTDTKAFHNFIYHQAELRFIKGRLCFNDCNKPAPFPSMIVIFRGVTDV